MLLFDLNHQRREYDEYDKHGNRSMSDRGNDEHAGEDGREFDNICKYGGRCYIHGGVYANGDLV